MSRYSLNQRLYSYAQVFFESEVVWLCSGILCIRGCIVMSRYSLNRRLHSYVRVFFESEVV